MGRQHRFLTIVTNERALGQMLKTPPLLNLHSHTQLLNLNNFYYMEAMGNAKS
jgi:hypothetical protein